MLNGIFSFSDLPIRLLFRVFWVFDLNRTWDCNSFFKTLRPYFCAGIRLLNTYYFKFPAINLFGLGIIGSYVWRAFENKASAEAGYAEQKF